MAGLRDIKRRIVSVKKTQQITRAMRMVAAAKLRRAQNAVVAARPYAERMRSALVEIARTQQDAEHPLLVARPRVRKLDVVVITSDRGLAGAFNANVLKFAGRLIQEREAGGIESVSLTLVGRKAAEYFRRRRPGQIGEAYAGLGTVTYDQAARIARRLAERYASGDADEVVVVYSEFVSTLNQSPRAVTLLPCQAAADEPVPEHLPFEIEPDAATLLGALVPKAIEVEVFRALLENQAGEHAARMAAMESATRNTEEMIGSLTLKFNRARQAAITRELVEIISGAEAL